MDGSSTVRKRVTTLYSAELEGEDGQDNLRTPPPQNGEAHTTMGIVRQVAEDMFVSMCKDFEQEVITEANVEDAVQNLAAASINPTHSLVQTHAYALSSEAIKASIRKLLQDVLKRSGSGEVTCELFCKAAIRHAKGNISLFDMLDARAATPKKEGGTKKTGQRRGGDHASLGTLLYRPGGTLLLMKREVLKLVEKRGSRWLWSFFSTKHFYWFLAVYFVPMMTIQVIVSSVSTALFNATMLFLLIVTIQTAIHLEVVQSRIEYLSLFQYFNKAGGLIKIPEISKSDAAHYVTFVGGVVMGFVFLGFSNHSFVYYELLALISLVASAMVVLQFDLYDSPLLWYCVLAKSPSWLVLGVEKMCSLVGYPPPQLLNSVKEPIWTVPMFGELNFAINLVTVLQVAFHLCILVKLFGKWKGNLGPHVLFLGWFVLCRNFISFSSAAHLAVITATAVLLPFYTLAFFLSPVYFVYHYGFLSPPVYYSISSIAIVGVVAALVVLVFKHRQEWWMNLSIEYVLLICLVACFFFVMFLSGWYSSVYRVPEPLPTVSMDEYVKYCSPVDSTDGNSVQTQINCMHLQGRAFHGDGQVVSVRISKTQNSMADSIQFLPHFLEKAVTCHLGEWEPMCGDRTDMSTCIHTGCHFQHSLVHTFEIKMKLYMPTVGDVKATILVSHCYVDFVLKVKQGTMLQFDAIFVEGMGSDHLTLQAQSLSTFGLGNTRNLDKEKELEVKKSMWLVLLQSVKNSISILLEIFFGYAV